jgi:hypothetical protein
LQTGEHHTAWNVEGVQTQVEQRTVSGGMRDRRPAASHSSEEGHRESQVKYTRASSLSHRMPSAPTRYGLSTRVPAKYTLSVALPGAALFFAELADADQRTDASRRSVEKDQRAAGLV